MYVTTVLAHGGDPTVGVWSVVMTGGGLVALAAGYTVGLSRLGRGSVAHGARRHGPLRVAAFAAGTAAVAVALLPPLDTAAEHLFAAHMTQHMLLMVVAAPVLVALATAVAVVVIVLP
jgi:cytochrome c oxidase assembly factor CtaG